MNLERPFRVASLPPLALLHTRVKSPHKVVALNLPNG